MKWTSKKPIYDDMRVIKRFLFFPLKIKRKVRWLETAYLFQRWNYGWGNENFAKKKDYDFYQRRL